jgi:hypothetical protein
MTPTPTPTPRRDGGKGRKERARHAARGRSRSPTVAIGAIATHDLLFETSKYNTCNIRLRKMKHLKHVFKTLAKTPKNT